MFQLFFSFGFTRQLNDFSQFSFAFGNVYKRGKCQRTAVSIKPKQIAANAPPIPAKFNHCRIAPCSCESTALLLTSLTSKWSEAILQRSERQRFSQKLTFLVCNISISTILNKSLHLGLLSFFQVSTSSHLQCPASFPGPGSQIWRVSRRRCCARYKFIYLLLYLLTLLLQVASWQRRAVGQLLRPLNYGLSEIVERFSC